MSVKIGLERGFESLAFEWGRDLRIAQQGEKSYVTFFTLRPPPWLAEQLEEKVSRNTLAQQRGSNHMESQKKVGSLCREGTSECHPSNRGACRSPS